MINTLKFNKLNFIIGYYDEVLNNVTKQINSIKSQIILPCSLYDLSQSNKNDYLNKCYASIDICTTDGIPIVWWFRRKLSQKIERVYGPELMHNLLKKTQSKKKGHVF